MKLNQIIKQKPYLSWYIKETDNLSDYSAFESILNYGTWDDVTNALKILSLKGAKQLFDKMISNKRQNLSPKTINYFKLYFDKHV